MRTRLLTAAALLAVPVAVAVTPPWAFLLMSSAAGLLVTRETLRLFATRGARPLAVPAHAAVLLLNLSFFRPDSLPLGTALALSAVLAFGGFLAARRPPAEALETLGATLAVAVFPGLLLASEVGLRAVDASEAAPLGGAGLLLFLYAVVFGNDAAAYFTGRALGRVRLIPRVSPNKTVEGFLGGLAGGVGLGFALDAAVPVGLGSAEIAGFGFVLALAGVLGDLSVSLLKRGAGVKDSGGSLPGHGGVLDRVDGLLFSSPLLLALVTAAPARPLPPTGLP